jgi:hypothetical protein
LSKPLLAPAHCWKERDRHRQKEQPASHQKTCGLEDFNAVIIVPRALIPGFGLGALRAVSAHIWLLEGLIRYLSTDLEGSIEKIVDGFPAVRLKYSSSASGEIRVCDFGIGFGHHASPVHRDQPFFS